MAVSQPNTEHHFFEDVHEILRNVARRQEEIAHRQEETDRMLKDGARRHEEIDRMLKETDRIVKDIARRQEETARQMKENDRQMKENDRKRQEEARQRKEEIDRQMKETDRKIGKLSDRLGEIIEYMVMPNCLDKFRELGYVFTKAYPHTIIKDEQNQIVTEVDITLENGNKVMLIEVKTKPNIEDIKDHIQRMEKVCLHGRLRNDTRTYLGAVAGMVFNDNEKAFALKNGFYAVEPSGTTFKIAVPEDAPREW